MVSSAFLPNLYCHIQAGPRFVAPNPVGNCPFSPFCEEGFNFKLCQLLEGFLESQLPWKRLPLFPWKSTGGLGQLCNGFLPRQAGVVLPLAGHFGDSQLPFARCEVWSNCQRKSMTMEAMGVERVSQPLPQCDEVCFCPDCCFMVNLQRFQLGPVLLYRGVHTCFLRVDGKQV